MTEKQKFTSYEKKLIRRYLIWCYKTTKESFERVERKFTQLTVDDFIADELKSLKGKMRSDLDGPIKEFEEYMNKKEMSALSEKFADPQRGVFNKEYLYLKIRLGAIEKAVVFFLGKKELTAIHKLYEEEMTKRILQARDHT
ncbi:MAG: hypothetical protein A2787_06440 [Omnitrophica WOR_2 bacterium RIFCSPHIGHO2_01_FULL_48_9]|nr:MAG: hypothetical protein A3D10_09185 [Omnitrophica WOR_2 bacterium RIFCSPHIGHO2_02_FULL_48_11]OGX31292.1 MAG: hypothetical protein A2787_06440 [Omnitrophica WOR_2 bacterium RIFCSPHIGHO2_01_FULL_48_9]